MDIFKGGQLFAISEPQDILRTLLVLYAAEKKLETDEDVSGEEFSYWVVRVAGEFTKIDRVEFWGAETKGKVAHFGAEDEADEFISKIKEKMA